MTTLPLSTLARSPRRAAALLLAVGAATILSACMTVGPDYKPPQVNTPGAFQGVSADGTVGSSASRGLTGAELAQWWERFGDQTLNALMQRAITNNIDLQVAQERVRESRALRGISASAEYPSVDTTGKVSRSRDSETLGRPGAVGDQNFFEAGVDASWEIDVFGGVRRDVEAADAEVGAAQESRNAVLVSLTAEVARNYIDLREAQAVKAITDGGIKTQADTADLVRTRLDAGLGTQLEVAQAQAQLAIRESQKPLLYIAERAAINRIAVLLGQYPADVAPELEVTAAMPVVQGDVPVGLPSELLRRRPDIRAAERRIAAATARIGVATADLFPRFSLSGSFGLRSEELGTFPQSNSRFWNIGPSVSWNIFDAGRIRRTIDAANSRERQSVLAYQQTVLTSVEEVENALTRLSQHQVRRAALDRSIAANKEAVSLSEERFRSGVSEFLNVLESQRQLYDAQNAAAQSEAEVLRSLIALYKSLGGGWPEPTQAETPPAPLSGTPAAP